MSTMSEHAGRGRRLAAAILDILIVGLVAFIALWPLGLFEHHQAYERVQLLLRLFALFAGSYLLVNGWLLNKYGQTIGKRLLGLKIVANDDGKQLPLWLLLVRAYSVLAVLAIPYLAILAVIDTLFIFTPQRRCLHDRLVGSRVQRIVSDKAQ